jgi:hypothetical protein
MWLKLLPSTGGSDIVLSWGNKEGPHTRTYAVGLQTVLHEAQNVRDRLNALARWGVRPNEATLAPILHSIVRAGFQLYYSLFDGATEADRAAAEELRQWIADQYVLEKDQTLRITANSSIHVPWGLVCERDLAPDAAIQTSIELFEHMWGMKYSLSATLSGYTYSRSRLERAGDRRRLLSLLNQEVVNAIADDQRNSFQAITDRRPLGPARTSSEFNELISGAGEGDTLVHFFGHQHAGQLILDDTDAIDVTRFKIFLSELIRRSGGPTESAALIFLSACDGAHGNADYSFIPAADRAGIMGLISTEAAVPRNYAAKFAVRFFDLLEGGHCVGDAMTQLRKSPDMWPLSVLYGCYAQPGYRFVPPRNPPPP